MKRTTIKDIAARLGVSISTVSRALKDHPDIGLAMREEVKRVSEELHYRPNSLAVGLRRQRSSLVGLIIPEITMFFFPSVIKGIQQTLQQRGYNVLILQSNDNLEKEIENINICHENGVDGLLLSVSSHTRDWAHLLSLQEVDIPIVLFDKTIQGSPFDAVVIDDEAVAAAAVQRLAAGGSRQIIGFFGNENLTISQQRAAGFRQEIARLGLELRADALQFACNSDEAHALTLALMRSPTPPDGIFAMSDEVVAGILPAVRISGKSIPQDCAVIAISDGFLPHYLFPAVSHIHHSGYEVGRTAAEHLCQLLREGYTASSVAGKNILLNTSFIPLQSTR